ncbi:MAG TPA: PAS domain-containing protein [Gemmatimonadales bacterium]|nr:PAS domain-containing protein [Gemmatimonadales bacterium]
MGTTLDIVPAGLALLDADGTVLSATPGFSRLLGCDASPVGQELGDLLCTLDDPDEVDSALDQLRRGEAVELEAWCWRGAEGPGAVCLVAAPLELEDRPAVFYCLVRDVTDQRLAAEEHARALSLHQATLRSMTDGLLVVDPAGGVLSFNQRFLEMWRIPSEAAASGRDADLLNAVLHQLEDPSGFMQRVTELYANPEASSSEEIRLADGRVFDRRSEPQRLAGRSVGRVWSFRDVTEARQAAEALRESQSLLELFFSQSLDGFFFMMLDQPIAWNETTDKEAALDYIFTHERITKVNTAVLTQFAAREDQMIGRTPAELLAHDIPGARARWREFLDAGHLHQETDERTLDGRPMIIEGDYICLYDREGRLIGHFGIQRDVTQRRQEENEILRSRQELRDLTARLQLVREEERTDIAREVHDELGQALTGLKIDLAWLKPRLADRPALAERVQSIIVRIDGAMDTVRRIATDLRPSVLDDLGLVAAVEWQAQEFERSTGITAQLEVQATYPELDDICATTTFRILQETLTNVARHAHATRVKIALQVSAEELTLEVRDNGRGISKSDVLSSTSLGLIGSRERAIACGGKLVIRGIRDQGTIVLLRIPARPRGGEAA